MKRRYHCQVNIPVLVDIEVEHANENFDYMHWTEEYGHANRAAIQYVITDLQPEAMTAALETLKADGLGYPGDFAYVCDSHDIIRSPIDDPVPTTRVDAMTWLRRLANARLDYHLDDNPAEIIDATTGKPTFTPEECEALRPRIAACFALLDDPFDVFLED